MGSRQLVRVEAAPLTLLQCAESHRPDGHPKKVAHRVAEQIGGSSNLTVPPLPHDHLQQGGVARALEGPQLYGRTRHTIKGDPAAPVLQGV
jgi:hypothetical protein